MSDDLGRVPSGSGSRPADRAAERPAPAGFDPSRTSELVAEVARLRGGLRLIALGALMHGPAWCRAQAHGFLNDLDFDVYPETGREETEPRS